jgi:hypothetical protein
MATCEVCGNDYYLSFEVITAGQRHVFDSFECAIHKLAPVCAHCGCKVIGHGIEVGDAIYCCANCARQSGEHGAVDHIWGRTDAVAGPADRPAPPRG